LAYNYYKILGVAEKAGIPEIKRAYRNLAKKYHPDRNSDSGSEYFIVLNTAYKVLSDPDKRKSYDMNLGVSPEGTSKATGAERDQRRKDQTRRSSDYTRSVYTPPRIWAPPAWVQQSVYMVGFIFGVSVTFFTFYFVTGGQWPVFMLWVSLLGIIVFLDSVSGIFYGHTLLSEKIGRRIRSWFIS
jgi:curved DNA-binding protein CbpA